VVNGTKTGEGIPKHIITDGPVVTKDNAPGMACCCDKRFTSAVRRATVAVNSRFETVSLGRREKASRAQPTRAMTTVGNRSSSRVRASLPDNGSCLVPGLFSRAAGRNYTPPIAGFKIG